MKANAITPQPTDDPRVFTLPAAPNPPESLQLFLNGILQEPGEEFELAGVQITYALELKAADRQRAWFETENRLVQGHN